VDIVGGLEDSSAREGKHRLRPLGYHIKSKTLGLLEVDFQTQPTQVKPTGLWSAKSQDPNYPSEPIEFNAKTKTYFSSGAWSNSQSR